MAYIGIDPNVGDITFQKFTGDGSATAFTLAQNVASGEAIVVTIGNVVQEPGASAAYTAYGNTLTFSAAPVNGDIITVRYFGRAVDQPLSYAMQLFKFVATASQTVFTGADNAGAILAFSGNDVDVYLNGVHLDSTDYTPTSGTTITLATAAALNDELVIRAYRAFSVTDTVSAASGGTFNGAVTFDAGANFGDNDKAIFGDGSDLSVWHNGSHSYVQDTGTGNLYLAGSNVIISNPTATETMAYFDDDGGASLWYDNAVKLATSSTGVDVTGAISSNKGSAGTLATFTDGVNSNFVVETSSLLTTIGNGGGSAALALKANNTEAMRINSSGNVGIGITTPDSEPRLHVRKGDAGGVDSATNSVLTLENSTTAVLQFLTPNTASQQIRFGDPQDTGAGFIQYNHTDNAIQFGTNGPEKMRLTSAGKLCVGTTSAVSLAMLTLQPADTNRIINTRSFNTSLQYHHVFENNSGTLVGGIAVSTTATAYNTSSDYRLKENVADLTGAADRVQQLAPKRFNFIADADKTVDGFLAHEVADIVPEAISGEKDAVDIDGNPEYQGIDQSKIVPLLTAALQEALTKIDQLETRIAALEAN